MSQSPDPRTDLPPSECLDLQGPEATATLGAALAGILRPGDTILLEGPIGAGKSHLARSLIQTRLAAENRWEDVPSPTFTLVQTYNTDAAQIVHADLYRLSDPDEVFELGLDTAFDAAITLVEWPDRLGSDRPDTALTIQLQPRDEGRIATLTFPAAWTARLLPILRGGQP